MILVAVTKDSRVEKLYKTTDSIDAITRFIKAIHPNTDVIQVNGITGFPAIGARFDGNKFLALEGE